MTAMNRTPFESYQDPRIDLASLLRMLFDHRALIGSIAGFFMVAGLAYAVLAPPIYQANVMLQIEPKKVGLDARPEVNDKPMAVSQATTEIELIKSISVLSQVVHDLQLDIVQKPKYLPGIGSYLTRHYKPDSESAIAPPVLWLNSYAWGGEKIDISRLEVPEALLGTKMTLIAGKNGAFTLHDSKGVQLLQGQVNQAINSNGVSIQIETLKARPGTEFEVTKNSVLATALSYQDRIKLAEAGRDSGIVHMSLQDADPLRAKLILSDICDLYQRQSIERSSAEAEQRLVFLRSQLPIVRAELEQSEAALQSYQNKNGSVDISIETKALLDRVVNLDSMLQELKLKRIDVDRLFSRTHPVSRALAEQMAQIESKKHDVLKRIDKLPGTQQGLLRLTREVQVTTQTYIQLLNKTQEQEIIRAGDIGNVHIIDKAHANEEPVKPLRKLIIIIATLLGGVLAVGVVFLRQAFYRGVENPQTIESLGLPLYASIPYSRRQGKLQKNGKPPIVDGQKLLSLASPNELAVESFRSLRTSLLFAMLKAHNNVLMISSPAPGAGKSFISSNLAVIVAQAGKKVLLIDADMRKGYLHKVLNLQPRHGLSDVLAARLSTREVINQTHVDNLDFISCGYAAPNPSDLLMHDNFAKLVKAVSPLYDLVIIDTPPVLVVTDATLIGRQAGISLLVLRFGLDTAKDIENAKRRLRQNGVHVKGAIFNAVQRKASNANYDGAYDYDITKQ